MEAGPMRNVSPVVLLVLAIVFGGLAAYMATGWLKSRSKVQPVVQNIQMMPVLVAAKDLAPGTVLKQNLLKVVQWPKDNRVEGAFLDSAELNDRVTRYPILNGEIILAGKLAPKGTPGGMAGIIQNEKRAVTIKVDEASGVAGFLLPGNRVDVLLTIDRHEFKDDPLTQMILQNLLVLGIGQDLEQQKSGEKPKVVPTVTLEVTPDEGERLALAAKEGQVTLALRGWTEGTPVDTRGIRTSSLVKGQQKPEAVFEAPPPAVVAPPKVGVEVLRGTEKETVNF
jgi:pilus assembly protein CpaB